MKTAFSGRTEFLTDPQRKKLEARLAKLAKFLDMKQGERQAHVSLRVEKRTHRADVSVLYKGDVLATTGEAPDMYAAAGDALEKLERQVTRVREKKQDSRKRAAVKDDKRGKTVLSADVVSRSFSVMEQEEIRQVPNASGLTVHRVNGIARRKPVTVDEAVLQIRKNQRYLIFRDIDTESVSILIRRADGDFDLVETGT